MSTSNLRVSLEAAQIDLIMHRLTTARTDLGWLAHALEEGTVPHAVAKAGHDAEGYTSYVGRNAMDGLKQSSSALRGICATMQSSPHIPRQAVVELERLLEVLHRHGWSGFIPADEALEALLNDE